MRFCVLRSICCTYLSWLASRPVADAVCVSRLPSWSTIVTFFAGMSGTLDDTMRVTASTCPSSSTRPGYRSTSTDADGASRSRTNTEGFGIARCTRAARTALIDSTVRCSSPSSARW